MYKIHSKPLLIAILAFASGVLILSTACHKEKVSPVSSYSSPYILDTLAQRSDYSLLHAAIIRAGLDTILKDKGAYTLFAPNDLAFTAAGYTQDSIRQMDRNRLNYLLRYLLLPTVLHTDTFYTFQSRSLYPLIECWNMDSLPLPLYQLGGTVYAQGGTLSYNDSIVAANGIIFPLSTFPQAPSGSIYQYLRANGFNIMASAIAHSDLLSLYASTTDTLTLLAPSDQAFINAGYTDSGSVLALGSDLLDSMIMCQTLAPQNTQANLYVSGYVGNSNDVLMPLGITRSWIIPGLAHNGAQYAIEEFYTRPWWTDTIIIYTPDTYQSSFLYYYIYNNGYNSQVTQEYDLIYQSDGSNYAFYRQLYYNADSVTIDHVIKPNIVTFNGLIHSVDNLLPHDTRAAP